MKYESDDNETSGQGIADLKEEKRCEIVIWENGKTNSPRKYSEIFTSV